MTNIVILGEAWGEEEAKQRAPFMGPSGWHLTKMLEEAGINRADCFLTNVFNLRPPGSNDVENLCGSKTDPVIQTMPALRAGKYVRAEYAPELVRLYDELLSVRPNLILALGNTAAWATLLSSGIGKIRGTVAAATASRIRGMKVLPTFHPAAVLRDWSLRHVTVLDMMKARRESAFPEIRRPERTIYIEPSLADLEWFYETHLANAKSISFDIETSGDQITCIGFAPNPSVALVIPFCDPRRPNGSYWPDHGSERSAWEYVRRVLSDPRPKIAQNGLYDINFLWARYGIAVANFEDDTMLLHHALMPESQKGLGFLGSVYSNEASWKLMRGRGAKETIKRDE